MDITVLDCTLRDGGYYNKWDFEIDFTQRYLSAINHANVDILELGFRNFPQNNFLGAFAYTTEEHLNTINLNKNMTVAVMVEANRILESGYSIDKAVHLLFKEKSYSKVNLVRVAVHFDSIEKCYDIVKNIKDLGYKIAINLMQSNGKSNEQLSCMAKLIQNWKKVDVLYFADSLGSMDSNDVIRIIQALKQGWQGELGIHAHNNKGLAISNTLTAIEHGVSWVDSTILGMGRGAGNAQTENLLLELEKKNKKYKPSALFNLVLSDFTSLKKSYGWGEGLLYRLAATYNIHPTYIQKMIEDNNYSSKEILEIINFIAPLETSHYHSDLVLQARKKTQSNEGSWSAKDWCLNEEILILGSGLGLSKYRIGIIEYIKTHRPTVLSLNIKHDFPSEFIDVYTSSNESKILAEAEQYQNLKKPLAISKVLLSKVLSGKTIPVNELWDYGINIKMNSFDIYEKECTLPCELSLAYALALATIGGARKISLVGFDGYRNDDIRQIRMNKFLKLYQNHPLALPVISLTTTTYPVKEGSIYAPSL